MSGNVYLDISIDGVEQGRIEFALHHTSAASLFRQLCHGPYNDTLMLHIESKGVCQGGLVYGVDDCQVKPSAQLRHARGRLSLVNGGPKFIICLSNDTQLLDADEQYTVIGVCVSGEHVLTALENSEGKLIKVHGCGDYSLPSPPPPPQDNNKPPAWLPALEERFNQHLTICTVQASLDTDKKVDALEAKLSLAFQAVGHHIDRIEHRADLIERYVLDVRSMLAEQNKLLRQIDEKLVTSSIQDV